MLAVRQCWQPWCGQSTLSEDLTCVDCPWLVLDDHYAEIFKGFMLQGILRCAMACSSGDAACGDSLAWRWGHLCPKQEGVEAQ